MLGDAYWARPLVCTGVLADSVLAGSRLADWAGRGGLLSRTPAPGTALKCRLCRLTRDRAAARQSGPMHAAPRQLGGFGCAARTSAAFTGAAAAAAELNPCGMVLDLCQHRKTFPLPKGQSWDVHIRLWPAGHITQTCKQGRKGTEQCMVVIFLRSSKVSRAYHSRTLHTADRSHQCGCPMCASRLTSPHGPPSLSRQHSEAQLQL